MTVECVTCAAFDLRGADKMARNGCGLCKHRPCWEFFGATFPRECDRHVPAKPDVVEARRAWLAKKGGEP